MFQINYGGTGGIKLAGGASYCTMVYAPNSDISFSGNSDFYGSVVGKTIKDTGGAHLHFDKNLEDKFFVVGNGMLSGFSWKKYLTGLAASASLFRRTLQLLHSRRVALSPHRQIS